MRGPVAFAVALFLAFSFALPVAADADCADFSTQAQAQAYFVAGGGSARYNFDRLDADGDGVACESLPSYGGASAGSSRSSYDDNYTEGDYRADQELRDAMLDQYEEAESSDGSYFGLIALILKLVFTPVGLMIVGVLAVIGYLTDGGNSSGSVGSSAGRDATRPTWMNQPSSSHQTSRIVPTAPQPVAPPPAPRPPTPSAPARNGYDTRTMLYTDYLQTSEWWAKRTSALRRANYRCQVCSRTDRLEVHHNTYERRGNEAPDDLIVLCAGCHEVFHRERGLPRR